MAEQETLYEQAEAAERVDPSVTYTRSGDHGETTIGSGVRASKAGPRVVASGVCEYASTHLGVVIALGPELPPDMVRLLARLQNDLADVASDLSTPLDDTGGAVIRIDSRYVERLERSCEHFNAELPPLPHIVVPGGTTPAALLFQARGVVRWAERAAQAAHESKGANPLAVTYLNRLGTLLFILAREANVEHGDTVWQPGLSGRLGDTELWEAVTTPEE